MDPVAGALARIVDQEGQPAGFGLLVAPGKVVTCAHVVAGAAGQPADAVAAPAEPVRLDFPLAAPGRYVTASVAAWRAMSDDGDGGDVAGLEFEPAAAPGRGLVIARGGDPTGHPVRVYGSEQKLGTDVWVTSRVAGRNDRRWLQLGRSPETGGLRVQAGFSGSPVWDEATGQVVGLVVRAALSTEVWAAFALPGQAIFEAWPELLAYCRDTSPFRGPEPFRVADAGVFFGREALAARAARAVLESSFSLVRGASGAGKTSMVNAAVTPLLVQGGHAVLTVRPSQRDDLWWALAAATADSLGRTGEEVADWERRLLSDLRGARPATRVRLLCERLGQDRLVVVVDQFEEPQEPDFALRLRELATTARPDGEPLARVVVVSRLGAEEVRARLGYPRPIDAVVTVPPLTGPDLRAAIERPALDGGLRYEEGLVDRIVRELGSHPYLPALQVTLTQLWRAQEPDGLLRNAAYERALGDTGALATYVEQAWSRLGEGSRTAGRRLLLHLVAPEETAYRRRMATRDELDPTEWTVAGALATQHLVVLSEGGPGGGTVELSHDRLLADWPALRALLAGDHPFLRWRDGLRRGRTRWHGAGRPHSQLLRGGELSTALAWARDREADLSAPEREFVAASRARRRSTRLRWTAAVTVLVVLATAALLTIGRQARETKRQAELVAARRATDASVRLRESDPVLAGLLSVAAFQVRGATAETRGALVASALARGRQVLRPGLDQIDALAFTPDGEAIVSGDYAGNVRFWRAASGTPDGPPLDATGRASVLAVSPDGATLAVVHGDRSEMIWLWDLATRRPLSIAEDDASVLKGHTAAVTWLRFSPEGETLFSAGEDGTVRRWDPRTRTENGPPVRTGSGVAALRSDGRLLAAVDAAGTVRLWDPRTGAQVGSAPGPEKARLLAFSPDGRRLAIAGDDATDPAVRLFDLPSRRDAGVVLTTHRDLVTALAFSPDGTILATGGADQTVRLGDSALGGLPIGGPLTGHVGDVTALAFSPDGDTLASGGHDGTIRLWDATGMLPTAPPLTGPRGAVIATAFSPDGRTVVAAGEDRTIRWWDVGTGTPRGSLPSGMGKVSALAFRPDGAAITATSDVGPARTWRMDGWQPEAPPLSGAILSVDYSPDGRLLATATWDGVQLWDVMTRQPLGAPLAGHSGCVYTVAFSPDGALLASGAGDGEVRLWDVAARRPHGAPLAGHTGQVLDLAFSPDGSTLASAASDGTLRLWDPRSGQPSDGPLVVSGGQARRDRAAHSLAFSPDGALLVSGTADARIRLWDVHTLQPVGDALTDSGGPIHSVALTRTGVLATASTYARLWDLSPVIDPKARICARAQRTLTEQEWRAHLGTVSYQRVC